MTTWNLKGTNHHILICNGSSCMRQGGEEITQAIRDEIGKYNLDEQIHTTRTRCNGRCKDACVVITYPEGVWYRVTTPELGREIISDHLVDGNPLTDLMIYKFKDEGMVPSKYALLNQGILKKERVD